MAACRILDTSPEDQHILSKRPDRSIEIEFNIVVDTFLDRSLMIGWRKNSWNPERVSSVFTFVSVCLSVCLCVCLYAGYRAHLLTYEPNFWVKWSMGHEKKKHFFVFRNFHFYAFYWHFSIFSLYNTSIFLFSSYWS